ncbi:hypothetical protein EDD86DRAFT_246879 [Gorgonomyces haynaldii]|nr:hypothetical protein EDD86DRAFT_246879 [Gorgonomyces haynaldii]
MLVLETLAKTLYLIRHAEKPPTGNTLSVMGMDRSYCLRDLVFHPNYPQFPIPQRIIAQQSKKSTRAYDTVAPLSSSIGIPVETDCLRDDLDCLTALLDKNDKSPVLIVWEHKVLGEILDLFVEIEKPRQKYPSDRFDLIWIVENGTYVEKKQCPPRDAYQ